MGRVGSMGPFGALGSWTFGIDALLPARVLLAPRAPGLEPLLAGHEHRVLLLVAHGPCMMHAYRKAPRGL